MPGGFNYNYTVPPFAAKDSLYAFPNSDPLSLEMALFLDSPLWQHFLDEFGQSPSFVRRHKRGSSSRVIGMQWGEPIDQSIRYRVDDEVSRITVLPKGHSLQRAHTHTPA